MLAWYELTDIELRNRDNDDVRTLLAEVQELRRQVREEPEDGNYLLAAD